MFERFQVQQRGVPGTCEILEALVDKLDLQEGNKMYVVDLTMNKSLGLVRCIWTVCIRSNEWGRAVWLFQQKHLASKNGWNWQFVAYHDPQDDAMTGGPIGQTRMWMAGNMMSVMALPPCFK